ncbi:MAG: hypothetical protein K0R62_7343 [Nonomuraea muscovyensis]|jgi:uncharacterized protein (DUF1015 family)|nr:hypothetical protein [Nonomuraea muscovyensis]
MGTPELPVPDGLVLRPFRGVRFAVDDPAKVTSPPYDLISNGDVRALLDSHPNNVVRLILPCTSPQATPQGQAGQAATPATEPAATPPGTSPATHPDDGRRIPAPDDRTDSGDQKYGPARDTLRAWLSSGVLVRDDLPALYAYEQSGAGVLQRGLIGDVGLADPAQGIILPHEDVFPGPVADRLALMSTTQANLEPIFLLYNGDHGAATRLVEEVATTRAPLIHARTDDGLSHRLWAITDQAEIDAVNADLRPRQALIADGHHRYATYRILQRQEHAARTTPIPPATPQVGPWDFGLALLVDSTAYPPDLKAIHRVIPDLPLAQAAARAKGSWQVHDHPTLAQGLAALDAAAEPAFLLAGEGGSHLLTDPDPTQLAHAMPADHSDRWNSLNTAVLTRFVMPKVWGMEEDEQAVRIVHHDAQAARDLAVRYGGTAVIIKPLAVDDVLAVAAAGERVPRKSTSFGPKPRTGLLLRTFATE